MHGHGAEKPLCQLSLQVYLAWLEAERLAESSPRSLEKYLSHLRGLLDYTYDPPSNITSLQTPLA